VSARVVVITGGASGFGLALAGEAASRGYDVAVLDRAGAPAAAESLVAEHGVEAIGLEVDVSSGEAVARAAAEVEARFGRCDVVISNVGVQLFGSVDRLTDDEWTWVLDVNVVGSARVARAFLPLLRRAPAGRLAFTTSSSVLDPASHMAAYQASKFAVWGLAETLRLELAGDGITVTTIFPSGMVTRHLETSADAQPAAIQRPIGVEDDFTKMLESNPGMAASAAMPEDLAGRTVDAVLAGDPYVITHGDLAGAIEARAASLQHASSG
jgi:NAD(P)-dependent dehydrogenase (short-subunit alcohol dehydrogenase family)